MKVNRVVLDTNVFISALLSSSGKPFASLSWALDNATILASRELISELSTRLARPKFAKYVSEERRNAFIVTAHPQRVLDNGGGPIDTGIPG